MVKGLFFLGKIHYLLIVITLRLLPFTFYLLQRDIPMLFPRVIDHFIFQHFKCVDQL